MQTNTHTFHMNDNTPRHIVDHATLADWMEWDEPTVITEPTPLLDALLADFGFDPKGNPQ